ncbi:hypothetical protein M427DRAFT_72933 [Gonapodya prolifera JEL478]|uniref:Chromatin modification-related protein n=1 Tax=Gonapodya prolifera (strain JEL478) TaxID=1344416 RepID=A0A139A4G2_GONPJ|nr:hypothetical protein M427DRAFT_72933 [Gonapodya prolifera JEL478]|eukprot:KXS11478.1 hypothetical protein M427DRAFT_72933 [Gonapodya prolifera JEL478]
MAMTTFDAQTFLEDYVITVENLPSEISHHFAELRATDASFQELRHKIAYEQRSLLFNDISPASEGSESAGGPEKHKELELGALPAHMKDFYKRAKVVADSKVDIADQTLTLLESHLRRLEMELLRYQNDDGVPIARALSNHGSSVLHQESDHTAYGGGYREETYYRKRDETTSARRKASRKKRKRSYHETSDSEVEDDISDRASVQGEEDGAPAEEEAVYCTCGKGQSYGDMVGCDAKGCPIEWYHLKCVGLTVAPQGTWYCQLCTAKKQQAQKRN